jgi:hypothetical protein
LYISAFITGKSPHWKGLEDEVTPPKVEFYIFILIFAGYKK